MNRPILAATSTAGVRGNLGWDALLELSERPGKEALHIRLTNAIREAIRAGRLPAGSALPPSRQLAAELGCSRWAVTETYEQLIAEGYVEGRVGSATRVRSHTVADGHPHVQVAPSAEQPLYDLRPGWAELSAFPRGRWLRAFREALATVPTSDLGYPQAGGHTALRRIIADYVHRVRGAAADAQHVTITSGILDGATMLARALRAAGHRAIAVENPAWPKLFQAIEVAGLEVVPVPVDSEGLMVDRRMSNVRAVLVAPAHQFPTGSILSPSRRAALLEWAHTVDGLILEDDYDAEFRYDRRPVGALQGIAPDRVALFASLSKTLAPAVGLGWCLTPPRWTDAVRATEAKTTGPSTLEQLTLSRFIERGDYDRQLRSERRRFRARRDRLIGALMREAPGCSVSGAAAGMHFIVELPDEADAATVMAKAGSKGLRVSNLKSYWYRNVPESAHPRSRPPQALVIGYGNLADEVVDEAAAVLGRAVRESSMRPGTRRSGRRVGRLSESDERETA